MDNKETKNDFESILPNDCKQYDETMARWNALRDNDVQEAYDLMKDSLTLAERWSEIQATSRKLNTLNPKEVTMTDFKTWAYHRYQVLKAMHDASRVIWRQANEYLMWSRKNSE